MSTVEAPDAVAAAVGQTGGMSDESSAVIPASGNQYTITAGDYEATIASVGATLRTLIYRGRDLVVPFEPDIVRPFFRGATLAPWPNRIVDGRYVFRGRSYEVALTEPGRGQALHGLASWLDFAPVETARVGSPSAPRSSRSRDTRGASGWRRPSPSAQMDSPSA